MLKSQYHPKIMKLRHLKSTFKQSFQKETGYIRPHFPPTNSVALYPIFIASSIPWWPSPTTSPPPRSSACPSAGSTAAWRSAGWTAASCSSHGIPVSSAAEVNLRPGFGERDVEIGPERKVSRWQIDRLSITSCRQQFTKRMYGRQLK